MPNNLLVTFNLDKLGKAREYINCHPKTGLLRAAAAVR